MNVIVHLITGVIRSKGREKEEGGKEREERDRRFSLPLFKYAAYTHSFVLSFFFKEPVLLGANSPSFEGGENSGSCILPLNFA